MNGMIAVDTDVLFCRCDRGDAAATDGALQPAERDGVRTEHAGAVDGAPTGRAEGGVDMRGSGPRFAGAGFAIKQKTTVIAGLWREFPRVTGVALK